MSRDRQSSDYLRGGRRDRLLRELDHDPYHAKVKLKDPTTCPDCSAVYHKGRWTWEEPPEKSHPHRCPACQRIHDKVPAAFLVLSGSFRKQHHDEIHNLIHNYAERERKEHPMKRIIATERDGDDMVITFTDAHLARGIGEAFHNAYEGDLDYAYDDGDIMLRVRWTR